MYTLFPGNCSAGQYFNKTCIDCPYGKYQEVEKPTDHVCKSCPDMQTTESTKSDRSDDCKGKIIMGLH